MKNQDISQNEKEEKIREFSVETKPIMTFLQATYYTLGILILLRLMFHNTFWGEGKDNLIYAIGTIAALIYILIRVGHKKKEKN